MFEYKNVNTPNHRPKRGNHLLVIICKHPVNLRTLYLVFQCSARGWCIACEAAFKQSLVWKFPLLAGYWEDKWWIVVSWFHLCWAPHWPRAVSSWFMPESELAFSPTGLVWVQASFWVCSREIKPLGSRHTSCPWGLRKPSSPRCWFSLPWLTGCLSLEGCSGGH